MNIRVAVIDDQDLMRAGFTLILNSEPGIEVVGEASDGTEVLALCRQSEPDVVLMDIRMPECNGIEATRQLIEAPDIFAKVLVLTTFDLDEYVFEAIRAGASGFLLKDSPAEKLLEAVRVVSRGESLLSPSVAHTLVTAFAQTEDHVDPEASAIAGSLTPRELDVLRLMAQGLSNPQIAGELYLGESTIKTHVSNLLMKLGVSNRVQAVVFAYQHDLQGPRP